VALGMIVRRFWPRFAKAMDKPVRIASVIILVVVIAGSVAQNWALLLENFGALSLITIVFCLISLTIGYFAPRLVKVGKRQSIASSFEIGIHNATLAIVIAVSVLGSDELSLPAAVYGVLMFFIAFGFGFLIRDRAGTAEEPTPDAVDDTATAAR
jgi:BASS family bile acid:Na+ symporter